MQYACSYYKSSRVTEANSAKIRMDIHQCYSIKVAKLQRSPFLLHTSHIPEKWLRINVKKTHLG